MERWLSLTTLNFPPSETPRVLISVPKRTVKLAVTRNRLKRVLREAVKKDPFFDDKKTYRIKVDRMPKKIDLETACRALGALHA